ncbi:MAG TPA: zf-HC2 domain-containing protein [Gemmatimonadaceae bacterium]
MTSDHIDVETLSAFADGDLNAVHAQRVERHLSQCAECSARIQRIRRLVAAVATLPRDVAPPPDALDAIRRRVTSPNARAPRWWHNGWLAAAAAVVLVVGTATVMRFATGPATRGDPTSARAGVTPAILAVEKNYAPTLAELRATFDAQRASLSPATVRTLDHSLAVIDSAIAEARAALAADPASAAISEMLSGYYQRKVDFLKRANTLSSSL